MFSCFVLCSRSLLRSEIEHLLHLPFFINVSCAFPCSFKFCSYYFCYTAIPSSIADQNCLITFVLLRHSLQYVRVPISVKTGKTPNLQPANKFTVGVIGTHAQTILFACSIIIGVCVCVQVYEDGDAPPNHAERVCAAEVYFNNFTTQTHAPLRSVQHNLSTSLSMNAQGLFPIPWQTDGTSTVSYAAPFVIRALLVLLRWDLLESHRGNPTQREADSLLLKGAHLKFQANKVKLRNPSIIWSLRSKESTGPLPISWEGSRRLVLHVFAEHESEGLVVCWCDHA